MTVVMVTVLPTLVLSIPVTSLLTECTCLCQLWFPSFLGPRLPDCEGCPLSCVWRCLRTSCKHSGGCGSWCEWWACPSPNPANPTLQMCATQTASYLAGKVLTDPATLQGKPAHPTCTGHKGLKDVAGFSSFQVPWQLSNRK